MSEQTVALVTGASRGIGKATAIALAKSGHYVVGTATSQKGADAISDYFKAEGLSGTGHVLNVTDLDSIETLMGFMNDNPGLPTVLVNNAGVTRDNLFMRMSEEQWDTVMDTNLKGVFRLTKACIRPMMKAKGGRIVNIGSIVGSMGNPGQANYCAAKAALLGFSKSLARELASRNITVNVIAPGFVKTDMTDVLSDEQKEGLLTQVPLGRMCEPEEIAAAVDFLCSKGGAYITGETLHVNGGMAMV